jgi:hypothetical protein
VVYLVLQAASRHSDTRYHWVAFPTGAGVAPPPGVGVGAGLSGQLAVLSSRTFMLEREPRPSLVAKAALITTGGCTGLPRPVDLAGVKAASSALSTTYLKGKAPRWGKPTCEGTTPRIHGSPKMGSRAKRLARRIGGKQIASASQ